MTPDPLVTAVVVTYNRSALLPQTLEALRLQTRVPDVVVIVNNASTDDTAEVIAAMADHHEFGKLDVLHMAENTGGAGGFAAGMGRALELGTDWVWVMDDDVAPEPECLEVLLAHTDVSECLQPQRFGHDGQPQSWEPILAITVGIHTLLDNLSFANGKAVAFTNVACFEGALVSARIIELVGLPDPAYFIVGDDTVFGLKASVHTNVAIVRDAHVRRLLPMAPFAPWKVYYLTRNAFLVRTDGCAYLDLTPTRLQNVIFGLNLALEVSRYVRRGRQFVRPALRGFRDGIAYARQHSAHQHSANQHSGNQHSPQPDGPTSRPRDGALTGPARTS